MKYLSFRFDVDTHKCIREGVPNIIRLADRMDSRCTFFVNPGRAVALGESLRILWGEKGENIRRLSAFHKLGWGDYVIAALVNPVISRVYKKQIQMIYDAGHEIGLHGGRNHELWYKYARLWVKDTISEEVAWGKKQLQQVIPELQIDGFASPGWNSPKELAKVLSNLQFRYLADIHGGENVIDIKRIENISIIRTAILGEPGGVGYIEYCRAVGMNDREIVKDFEKRLSLQKQYAVVYDHPYYAGVRELGLLGKLMEVGKEMGYKIVRMREIVEKVSKVSKGNKGGVKSL